MKNAFLTILLIGIVLSSYGKKVKFAVDLTDIEVSFYGVHVTGDFQTLAGFEGGDWNPNSTPLAREGVTTIYSTVIDIPAFAKYEFRYVNGDQFYETEFVPLESRVGYDFDDNRWIFVDSTANDTTFSGAVMFGGNAPKDMVLVRFLVNMQNVASISPVGVHVAGNFQGWNPAEIRLYSFGGTVYEIIAFVGPGDYGYKFFNGNTLAESEVVPVDCEVNGSRRLIASEDIVLEQVCFSGCVDCTTGIEKMKTIGLQVYPNPVNEVLRVNLPLSGMSDVLLIDCQGRQLISLSGLEGGVNQIPVKYLKAGIYRIIVFNDQLKSSANFVKN
jgi:hypothetical protein